MLTQQPGVPAGASSASPVAPPNPLAGLGGFFGAEGGADASAFIDQFKVANKKMTARELFAAGGTVKTMNMLQKMQTSPGSGGFSTDPTVLSLKLASHMASSYLSYTALEVLMNSFAENPNLMNEVTVDVPMLGLATGQLELQEEILGVARFLAAMTAANRLTGEGEKRLEQAKSTYAEALKAKAQAIESWGAARTVVNGVSELAVAKGLSQDEKDYLMTFSSKEWADVMKDTAAKEIIAKALAVQNPALAKQWLQSEREVVSHYREYTKTAVGSLSMLGFGALFLSNAVELGSRSDGHKLLLVPMAKDGAVELISTIKTVVASVARNDILVEGSFVLMAGDKVTRGISASSLMGSLSEAQLQAFQQQLIGVNSSYLTQLDRRCSDFASDVLDRLVDKDIKAGFLEHVGRNSVPMESFTFKTAFAPKQPKGMEFKALDRNVKSRVYSEDHVESSDPVKKWYGEIQRSVRQGATKLNNQDLRRIMLLQSAQGTGSFDLAGARIVIETPGMQGLADQHDMAARSTDCEITARARPVVAPAAEPKPTTKPAPTKKPSAKPAPARKPTAKPATDQKT